MNGEITTEVRVCQGNKNGTGCAKIALVCDEPRFAIMMEGEKTIAVTRGEIASFATIKTARIFSPTAAKFEDLCAAQNAADAVVAGAFFDAVGKRPKADQSGEDAPTHAATLQLA